jgi:RNA polymerase subunit RPABC4/transcription elongation factor Spt4
MNVIEQMVEAQERSEVCPVCGETSPGARWICLTRFSRPAADASAEKHQCDYSIEGHARLSAALADANPKDPTHV